LEDTKEKNVGTKEDGERERQKDKKERSKSKVK
jgi:hypothetical protein